MPEFQPINYAIDVKDPFQAALQGYSAGAAIRDDQRNQAMLAQQQQAQLAAQQQLLQAQQEVFKNPTADNYAKLMTLDPKSSEAYQRAWTTRSTEQQRGLASDLLQWGAAIKSGKPQLAADALAQRADLLEQQNGGQPTQDSQAMRVYSKLAAEHPEFALGQIQAMLAVNPTGKDAAETLSKFGSEQRAAELQPSAMREASAKATTAEVGAKYAEPGAKADLAQKAAQLGLTKAQTTQAVSLTKKYDAETQKAILDVAASGQPTPQQRFDAEAKLRSEYTNATKGYTDVTESYRRLKASNNDAAGDLSLIFSYMKMLDPGSVVREGEFATAQNAAGVPDRVRNLFNRLLEGKRLTDGQRAQFTGQAESLYSAAQKREGEARAGIAKVAKSYGLNSENIFGGRASETTAPPKDNGRPPLASFEKVGG